MLFTKTRDGATTTWMDQAERNATQTSQPRTMLSMRTALQALAAYLAAESDMLAAGPARVHAAARDDP
jgi:hypothetical protein